MVGLSHVLVIIEVEVVIQKRVIAIIARVTPQVHFVTFVPQDITEIQRETFLAFLAIVLFLNIRFRKNAKADLELIIFVLIAKKATLALNVNNVM